ncbi:neprilysin-1-like [Dermacentor variabilis]|uniref:neprilysin-1-like n=1 Tax=Dermacentor variabilis TaxID=34621 RepID=UPI003F5BC897
MGISWPYLYPLRRQTGDAADGARLVLEALVNASVRWGFPVWFDVAVNLSRPRTVVIETLTSFPRQPDIEVWSTIRVYRSQFERLVLAMYKLFTKSDAVYDNIEPFLSSHWHVQSFVNNANKARDIVRFDNLATFAANLTANITPQAWADVLSAALDVRLTVEDTPVIVIGAPFLVTFNRMLLELNADSLLLYLGWAFQLSMARVLSREVAASINGRGLPNADMADYCFLLTEHLLGFALTAPALHSNVDTERKQAAEAVYNFSTSHFRKALQASPWMDDNATKLRTFASLTALQLDWTADEHLPWEKLYASVPPVTHDSFVPNWRLLVQARSAIRSSMLAMNARYHSIDEDGRLDEMTHRLTVPVARLQPPLFYGVQEPSVAVALLGSWFTRKVAQHVFHADWLISGQAKERYDSAMACFEPDFGGNSLSREEMAAIWHLEPMRRAFLASNTSMPGVTSAELRLPGLEVLQGEQIFFALLCFTLCGGMVAKADATGWAVSGEKLCNVPLMHSTHFANAFQCPAGSPMNPEFKCTFW